MENKQKPEDDKKVTGLDLLRVPFAANQISRLPKPTKKQTEEVKADFKKGIRCKECGGWHHKDVIHLDYVGHAALTDRLLDADIKWCWEPLSFDENGLPRLDKNGGMWIKLTVCGVTRIGYGHPDGKTGGDAIKETIGDALRNAAMRFGAALDLWHKGSLHITDEEPPEPPKTETLPKTDNKPRVRDEDMTAKCKAYAEAVDVAPDLETLEKHVRDNALFMNEVFDKEPAYHARLTAKLNAKRESFSNASV